MTVFDLTDHEYAPRGSDLYKTLVDRQTVTTACAHCPAGDRWTVTGTLAETRTAFTTHRATMHPEVVPSMPNVRAAAMTAVERRSLSVGRVLPLRDHGQPVADAA